MGFLELQRQCGVSHEVLRGAQGASHVALGKSGLHAHCEGERVIALESWKVYRASRTVKEGLSRCFLGPPNSRVSLTSQRHTEKLPEATGTSRGNPGFPAATRKGLESPSLMCLEARFPYHGSRAMTRSQ